MWRKEGTKHTSEAHDKATKEIRLQAAVEIGSCPVSDFVLAATLIPGVVSGIHLCPQLSHYFLGNTI